MSLSLPEVEGIFKSDASVSVSVTTDGKAVVNAPRYVGVVSWKGNEIEKEMKKAQQFATRPALVGYKPPAVFALAASLAEILEVREASLSKVPTKSRRASSAKKKRSIKAKRSR